MTVTSQSEWSPTPRATATERTPKRRRTSATLLASAGLLALAAPAAAALPADTPATRNVELVTTVPTGAAISGEFARTGEFFYVSSLNSISVLDYSGDPTAPRLRGTLAMAEFENEAMTYGERRLADGTLRRFVLVGNDLVNATADVNPLGTRTADVQRGRIGGGEVVVVDVTDPDDPRVVGRTPGSAALPGAVTTSTHTVQCVTVSCETAYTAGDSGEFSIVDLTDLTAPRQVATAVSPAAGGNEIFSSGAGHYWDVDAAGVAWHTGSGGAAAFSVKDPRNPVVIQASGEQGTATPYNDFIHHNAQRPNATAFKQNREPSFANGNVLLVTEEDYANDGDEVSCTRAGSFLTWHVPDLNGGKHAERVAAAGGDPGVPDLGTITNLDAVTVGELGGGLTTPVGAFCSAHWFDVHQDGIVALGAYQQGLRLLDVRDPRAITQYGYWTPTATETWDAYFVPQRDAAGVVVPGRKTEVIYTADATRGVDVLRMVPVGERGSTLGTTIDDQLGAALLLPLGGGSALLGAAGLRRRRARANA